MLTVPDNRNEDNPAAGDESTATLAGEEVGGAQDEERVEPPTLDRLAREGARRMLMAALEAEVTEYIEGFAEVRDADGRRLVVRKINGFDQPCYLVLFRLPQALAAETCI